MCAPSKCVQFGRGAILLCSALLQAQQNKPPEHVCGCPDGRQFVVGASMYGKSSARVLITGLRPDAARSARGDVPRCTDVLVLGQAVRLLTAIDGRPYLKRESLKRGAIRNVCRTRIHFITAPKSYDFFADDGTAVTLSDQDAGEPSDPNSAQIESSEARFSEDLTGKDLLQILQRPGAFSPDPLARPGDSPFDEHDFKEGAYFIVRRRLKAEIVIDQGAAVAHSVAESVPKDVSVYAGTLGRIEKRAGTRSEPLWVVQLLPNSAPRPFWRSVRHPMGETRLPMTNVVLASSQIAEINDFFDRYGVEWTRFGEEVVPVTESAPETTRLQQIYARPK